IVLPKFPKARYNVYKLALFSGASHWGLHTRKREYVLKFFGIFPVFGTTTTAFATRCGKDRAIGATDRRKKVQAIKKTQTLFMVLLSQTGTKLITNSKAPSAFGSVPRSTHDTTGGEQTANTIPCSALWTKAGSECSASLLESLLLVILRQLTICSIRKGAHELNQWLRLPCSGLNGSCGRLTI